MKHKVKSLEDLKYSRKKTIHSNKEHNNSLSKMDRLALFITNKVGTMGFFITIFTWTTLWLGWNILAPNPLKFDPVPACVFWLFISNMIQIFLMPLLMIGQNLQSRHSEIRADNHYDVSIKTEEEIDIIIEHLENQNELLNRILNKK